MGESARQLNRGFHVEIRRGAQKVAEEVAGRIIAALRVRPALTLGLPTGSTAMPVHAALVAAHREGRVSFARCDVFAVDEYLGLEASDARSYARFLRDHLVSHIDLPAAQFHVPDGLASDPSEEADRFAQSLAQRGGFDLLFLGLGANGHLAFNEPGSPRDARTRYVQLDESTLAANSRFFRNSNEQPTEAITIGLAEIMEARQVIVAATGESKARAVAAIRNSQPVSVCPAGILNGHPNACLIIDEAAGGS
ncbi:glucosamine-6-phosphate deaminase [Pontivivens ytuae]|uniref:Glucosamine-6-phosphate deaminase n=1 Tax=Pontivivens ytuae TaxID=2789856 RepID=A0A7S9QE31_9RHOB|nr:glucosamine-6-phosphate deaminase [Pontivivens ytuae]QPH54786.1 glucosamine-6-phosphate deaminase [Pontivivens ytuae]